MQQKDNNNACERKDKGSRKMKKGQTSYPRLLTL